MQTINVAPETKITYQNQNYIIVGRTEDMESLLVRSEDGNRINIISISNLLKETRDVQKSLPRIIPALETVDKVKWQEALHKRDAIKRAFEEGVGAVAIAEELGIHVATLYDLRNKFDTYGLECLVKQSPDGGAGKIRLSKKQYEILVAAVKNEYLTNQKKCVAAVYRAVKQACNAAKVKIIGRSTVYRHCEAIDQQIKEKKRNGKKAAKDKFAQTFDGYQEATRPLEIIQIDHSLMDIIVVDDETREPIGRPWLTIAIDVFSRMVYGFIISLDPPSTMSTALCLQQAICRKEQWLTQRGIDHKWVIYGFLETLHSDNGKDFHSLTLRRGCNKHDVNMVFRPVGKPEYGAHIERLIGTFMGRMKLLPGATFSNIKEKGDYDSEAKAVMTLAAVEKWFGTLVTGEYHKAVHSVLHMSPEQKFLEGLQGIGNVPAAGINRICIDEKDLLMDFTPFFEKTVQGYGLQLDCIRYNCPELKRFLHAMDPKTGKKKKFIVRRDPRDISRVFFLDPETQRYITVPYRNPNRPKISLFEQREALKKLKERGKIDQVTEDEIFRTYDELRAIEEQETKDTKKARRNRQRRKLHRLETGYDRPTQTPAVEDVEYDVDETEAVPFDEIEMA